MNKTQIIKNIKSKEDKIKEDKKKEKQKSKDDDSSDISSYNENYENMSLDEISQKGKEKFFQTELMEKIVKYIKIDDTIKDKQKELRLQMKALKTQKIDMEKYIISYLEAINQEFVNIEGTAKLTKTISNTKGAIKVDNIKLSLIDGIKKQNIKLDENKINELLDSVIDNVEKNRPTKTKTYIKRTKGKINKSIVTNNSENKKNNDEDDDSNENLPLYDSNK
jgi:hypothetical protein